MGVAVVIAIVLILLAAAAVILSTVRRREVTNIAAGLSRESVKRDQTGREAQSDSVVAAPVGREIERAAVLARSGTAVVAADSKVPTLWVPPDPETIGVTRRQFLNRSIVTFMGINIAIFGVISLPVFLWPSAKGGFGSKIRVGKIADVKAEIEKANGVLYVPDGRMYMVEYPATALPKAQITYKGLTSLPGMEVGIVALYQKCVHLGCRAVLQLLQVVRVPVSRLAVQPRRREEGWARSSWARPLRHRDRRRRPHRQHRRHRARPADRHEHDRSGSGGSALCLIERCLI